MPTRSILAFAVSVDGGETFLCDVDNYDTYNAFSMYFWSGTIISNQGGSYVWDSLAYSDYPTETNQNVTLFITPGSDTHSPIIQFTATTYDDSFFAITKDIGSFFWLNPNAAIQPPAAPINVIRILPYGNGDCNPPTSGDTFTANYYFLWGIPIP